MCSLLAMDVADAALACSEIEGRDEKTALPSPKETRGALPGTARGGAGCEPLKETCLASEEASYKWLQSALFVSPR
jgi:hypothetical protein